MLAEGIILLTLGGAGLQSNGEGLEAIRAFHPVSERIATSGQVTLEQLPLIKAAGFEVLVNLAPADEERNRLEDFHAVKLGLTYVHIPVDWNNPSLRDLELFFKVMEANKDRKVFVHCFANMRVSVFIYLYRTLVLQVPEDEAKADLLAIWDPRSSPQWASFLEEARRKQAPAP